MTDPRPRPQYGEYAPIPPVTEPPATELAPPSVDPPTEKAPEPAKRNTRDLIITTALLVIGVWDVVTSFALYADLSTLIQQAYDQLGVGEYTASELGLAMGGVINGGRILVLLIVIALSLWRISRGKLAFWIPLAGAVVAGIFVGICTVIVMANDPVFIAFSQGLGS